MIKKLLQTTIFFLIIFLIINSITTPILGQIQNPAVPVWGNPNQAGLKEGGAFIGYAVTMWKAGITVAALIVIVYYIQGGYEWLTSGDKTDGVEKAKKRFLYATIGLIILVSSFTLIDYLLSIFFGNTFDIFNLTLPNNL
jgi:hypothetical protein